jgi:hypothetical protein
MSLYYSQSYVYTFRPFWAIRRETAVFVYLKHHYTGLYKIRGRQLVPVLNVVSQGSITSECLPIFHTRRARKQKILIRCCDGTSLNYAISYKLLLAHVTVRAFPQSFLGLAMWKILCCSQISSWLFAFKKASVLVAGSLKNPH